jgi:predicted dehydrogenase
MRTKAMPVVTIGLVGAGFLAETRARCYAACRGIVADIGGVAAGHRERAASYAQRWSVPRVYDDYHQLIADPAVDIVDICTPNALHAGIAIAAARAGKHVICTKPLTGYFGIASDPARVGDVPKRQMYDAAVREATAMVDAADQSGVRLMYAENWVYAPAIQRARALIEVSGGAVLEIRGAERHSGSHAPSSQRWRTSGGGSLIRLAAHPVGAALYLKRVEGMQRDGRPIEPASVVAEVGRLSAVDPSRGYIRSDWEDLEDWGTILLTFTDGTRAVLSGSDVQLGGMQSHLELSLSNGRILCQLSPTDLCQAYAPDTTVWGETYLMEKLETAAGWNAPAPDEPWAHGHVQQIQDFVEAVAHNRAPLSDGRLGSAVVRVIYAAYVAAEEGRRVDLGGDVTFPATDVSI